MLFMNMVPISQNFGLLKNPVPHRVSNYFMVKLDVTSNMVKFVNNIELLIKE